MSESHTWEISVPAASLPIQLPTNDLEKAAEDGPSLALPLVLEIWMKHQALGFILAQTQPLRPSGE